MWTLLVPTPVAVSQGSCWLQTGSLVMVWLKLYNTCGCVYVLQLLITPVDTDECATGMDTCDQNCHNTNGSFICNCNTGYTLNSNGRTCDGMFFCRVIKIISYVMMCLSIDDDECRMNSTNTCQHVCVNTAGSYRCSCNSGFRINSDGRSCTG